jgi:hypothetical protein
VTSMKKRRTEYEENVWVLMRVDARSVVWIGRRKG